MTSREQFEWVWTSSVGWQVKARREGRLGFVEARLGDGEWRRASPKDFASVVLLELLRLAEENEDLKLRLEQVP